MAWSCLLILAIGVAGPIVSVCSTLLFFNLVEHLGKIYTMSEKKTDNEYLEEILYHTKESRRSIDKIKGNTLVVALAVILSAIGTLILSSNM